MGIRAFAPAYWILAAGYFFRPGYWMLATVFGGVRDGMEKQGLKTTEFGFLSSEFGNQQRETRNSEQRRCQQALTAKIARDVKVLP